MGFRGSIIRQLTEGKGPEGMTYARDVVNVIAIRDSLLAVPCDTIRFVRAYTLAALLVGRDTTDATGLAGDLSASISTKDL